MKDLQLYYWPLSLLAQSERNGIHSGMRGIRGRQEGEGGRRGGEEKGGEGGCLSIHTDIFLQIAMRYRGNNIS